MNAATQPDVTDEFTLPRHRMVERLRDHYGISDKPVLDAMFAVPRHIFVPAAIRSSAYKDSALPLAAAQTVSQPYIVAKMTELLELKGDEKVLEIGSGSGYQTAVVASLARWVYAVERLPQLVADAEDRLRSLRIHNVTTKTTDGTNGLPAYAPFDAILVAAGGPVVPTPLLEQLKPGGRLVIPVGETENSQRLVRVIREEKGYSQQDFGPCAFVPLIGEHGWGPRS